MAIEGTHEHWYYPEFYPSELLWLNQRLSSEVEDPILVGGPEERGPGEGSQAGTPKLEYENDTKHSLLVRKELGIGRGLNENEADELYGNISAYRASLLASGWRLPEAIDAQVVASESEHRIVVRERYIAGDDGEEVLSRANNPLLKTKLISDVIETLYNYPEEMLARTELAGEVITRLPHGLDLKPSNLVLQEGIRLHIVDTFAPKLLDEAGTWQIFSSKLETYEPEHMLRLCATREGAVLRFCQRSELVWQNPGGLGSEAVGGLLTELLEMHGSPADELRFIRQQIATGYPWLNP